MSELFFVLCATSVIASALVGGVFLSFSELVMRSLILTGSPGGAEAMQHINRVVFRTVFMVLLIGLSIVSPVLMIMAWDESSVVVVRYVLVGGASYLTLVFGVTLLGNVPLNIRLDRVDAGSLSLAAVWSEFYPDWIRLNHLRTLGSGVTSVCYLLACLTA